MNYLPLQYCMDLNLNELPEVDVLEKFFNFFSNRDFGTYQYSFSSNEDAEASRKILMSAEKPRKVEMILQPFEVELLLNLWQYTKQVYKPDPFFSKKLKETESIKVYPELLRRIPYKDFYIDFEENDNFKVDGVFVSVRVYNNDEIRIMYMITEKKQKTKIVDIIEFCPDIGRFKKLQKEVKLDKNKQQILEMDNAIIEQQGGTLQDKRICTGENYIKKPNQGSYYNFDKSMCPKVYQGHNLCYFEIDRLSPEDSIADVSIFIIQFLLYLSSKEPDIKESEITKTTYRPYKKHKNKFSQVKQWEVAYRYGEKIHLLEEKEKENTETKGGTHASPKPHTRCAHWHSYWCGSGENKHIELRWLDFMYVNGNVSEIVAKINETSL